MRKTKTKIDDGGQKNFTTTAGTRQFGGEGAGKTPDPNDVLFGGPELHGKGVSRGRTVGPRGGRRVNSGWQGESAGKKSNDRYNAAIIREGEKGEGNQLEEGKKTDRK